MTKHTQRSSPPPTPPSQSRDGKKPIVVAVLAIAAVAVAAFAFIRSDNAGAAPEPEASAPVSTPAATPISAPAAPADPQLAALKPHIQKDYPQLHLPQYPLGRSPEVITAAYRFAAEHPEVLTFVPCFCGCERSGHRGNEDCFVKSRAANGDVQEWEDHGMECNVCLDVAQQAMQMYSSGASVRDIRAAVESKWAPQAHTHTPTPGPPR